MLKKQNKYKGFCVKILCYPHFVDNIINDLKQKLTILNVTIWIIVHNLIVVKHFVILQFVFVNNHMLYLII